MDVLVPAVHRQHDDPRRRVLAADLAHRIDAARRAQAQVHQRDVGQMLSELGDGLVRGRRHGHDAQVGLARDDERDALAHDAMVVDAQDADRRRRRHIAAGRRCLISPARGTVASIAVPPPALDVTVSEPSSSSARSRMVVSP